MRNHQKGFSVVEVVMGVVIVGLLGALGWMYWTNVANKPKDETKSSETNSTVVKSSPTPVAKKTYRTKNFSLAFDYPSSWTLKDISDTWQQDSKQEGVVVESDDGFKLVYGTIPYGGLGGAGYDRSVTDFKLYDTTEFAGHYVLSFVHDGKFNLSVMKYNTIEATNRDFLNYGTIIKMVAVEPKDGVQDPYAVQFGTKITGWNEGSTTKPSEKILKEAVDILKSFRKI